MLVEQSTRPSNKTYTTTGKHYLIGIDPGRNTGVAIYKPSEKRLVKLDTLGFWTTIDLLQNFHKLFEMPLDNIGKPYDLETLSMFSISYHDATFSVVIEDPNSNDPTWHGKGRNVKILQNIAQKIGRNKEQAFLLIEYMTRNKIDHRTVQPKNHKWDAKDMIKITKWREPTNEHVRDAARLVWGY